MLALPNKKGVLEKECVLFCNLADFLALLLSVFLYPYGLTSCRVSWFLIHYFLYFQWVRHLENGSVNYIEGIIFVMLVCLFISVFLI